MKNLAFLSVVFFLLSGLSLWAQDAGTPVTEGLPPEAPVVAADAVADTTAPAPAETPVLEAKTEPAAAQTAMPGSRANLFESTHFSVRSEVSAEHAQKLAAQLEAYLEEFNSYFRFDLSAAGLKFKVKIYADKVAFDKYLTRLISETRDDYVYLHYSDKARSELVGYQTAEKTIPESSLVHQAFIQYLRAFIPNPPLWIREGFAVYFESLAYNAETGKATAAQNLAWLETYKDIAQGSRTADLMTSEQLLSIGVEDARAKINVFYPQAWALVNYLALGPSKEHNRVLWDAIRLMSPEASLAENSKIVAEKAFKWVDAAQLAQAQGDYFKAKKTFRELVLEGVELYAANKLAEAEASFNKSLELQTGNHIPYYYLGLINYDKANFGKANEFYQSALAKGADATLTNYALGVNAYADNQFENATVYLKKVLELDASYADKVKEIMDRMEV